MRGGSEAPKVCPVAQPAVFTASRLVLLASTGVLLLSVAHPTPAALRGRHGRVARPSAPAWVGPRRHRWAAAGGEGRRQPAAQSRRLITGLLVWKSVESDTHQSSP